mgnify:CR=1 FL=1
MKFPKGLLRWIYYIEMWGYGFEDISDDMKLTVAEVYETKYYLLKKNFNITKDQLWA